MRVALVHDWLTGMRGGEKVLAAIAALFPQADLFTLIYAGAACQPITRGRRVTCSFLNDLPGVRHYYRHLLPIMPFAIEQFDLRGYDLVISSSHCVAKGIRPQKAKHICYCHTPMRYLWQHGPEYARHLDYFTRSAMSALTGYLKAWDVRSAARVDAFIANSHNVAQRIRSCYGRSSRVIYPPIDTDFFTPANLPREDFYLMVTALVPYKRIDHAMQAAARLARPLRIIGGGPMLQALRNRAPANVQFLGWRSDADVRDHYRRCRALLLPAEEDFGMTVMEAMACGTPVIACNAGGALETVTDSVHGLLYDPPTPDGLLAALQRFESMTQTFDPQVLRRWAQQFGPSRFATQFTQAIAEQMPFILAGGLGRRVS